MIPFDHLGAALRQLREERGWTLTRLLDEARKKGVSFTFESLRNWEGPKARPSARSLAYLLTALEANLVDLHSALMSVSEGSGQRRRPAETAAEHARNLLERAPRVRQGSPERELLEASLEIAALLDRDAKSLAFYADDLAGLALKFFRELEAAGKPKIAKRMAALHGQLRKFEAALHQGLLVKSAEELEAERAARDTQKVGTDEGDSPQEGTATCDES